MADALRPRNARQLYPGNIFPRLVSKQMRGPSEGFTSRSPNMIMKCKAVVLSLGFLLAAAGGLLPSGASRTFAKPSKPMKPITIGMIPLLAAPQRYNGKIIRTWGFLVIARTAEDDSLWFHKEDADAALWKDSFQLELADKQREQFRQVSGTYVVVEGTLNSKGPDNSSLFSGTISNVTVLYGWKPYVPPSSTKLVPCVTARQIYYLLLYGYLMVSASSVAALNPPRGSRWFFPAA